MKNTMLMQMPNNMLHCSQIIFHRHYIAAGEHAIEEFTLPFTVKGTSIEFNCGLRVWGEDFTEVHFLTTFYAKGVGPMEWRK